jgi:hypothetical protein
MKHYPLHYGQGTMFDLFKSKRIISLYEFQLSLHLKNTFLEVNALFRLDLLQFSSSTECIYYYEHNGIFTNENGLRC